MSEREEYTAETYPSFGKKYNGEKAIISLTSWKARINTVSKTLYSLLNKCPGFHIVLVLSEEEFPKMMNALPENLKIFAENELIEFLWVKENLKSHKKYFYTIQKYNNLPIILADDDLTYLTNFAEKLYNKHLEFKDSIIANRCHLIKFNDKNILPYKQWEYETKVNRNKKLFFTSGAGTLLPPNFFNIVKPNISDIKNCLTADDIYLNYLTIKNNIEVINLNNFKQSYKERTENIKNGLAQYNTKGNNLNDKYINEFKNVFIKIKV